MMFGQPIWHGLAMVAVIAAVIWPPLWAYYIVGALVLLCFTHIPRPPRDQIQCRTGSALRASITPPPDQIQWYYLSANKYSYYVIPHAATLDQEPQMVQPHSHHIRLGMVVGLEH